jgi:hypothetical protein
MPGRVSAADFDFFSSPENPEINGCRDNSRRRSPVSSLFNR